MASEKANGETPIGDEPAESDWPIGGISAARRRSTTTIGASSVLVAVAVGVELITPGVLRSAGLSAPMAEYVAYAIGVAILGGGGFVTYLAWRVFREPQISQAPDIASAGIKAVGEIGEPDEVARRTLPLLWDRSSWIIRRVEHIHFRDRTMVRRHVSVDYRIPADLLEVRFGGDQLDQEELELLADGREHDGQAAASRRFIPISVLRSWPPVLNLDLRDAFGNPMPLLSKATTNALDGRVLLAIAEDAVGPYIDDLREDLLRLVHDDGVAAQLALVIVTEGLSQIVDDVPDIDVEKIERLVDLARLLVHSTLLWVAVDKPEETRQIIKLAYDEPVRRGLSVPRAILSSLGLRTHVVGFEVGQAGDAGSYHLEIAVPFPLEVLDGVLTIASDAPPIKRRTRWQRLWSEMILSLEYQLALALNRNPPHYPLIDRTNFRQLFTRRVHFYASGQHSSPALAMVRLTPERRGVPLAGAVTGLLVAVTLTAFNQVATQIYEHPSRSGLAGASVGFLLLAPGLISFVLTRPSDHPFATRLLSGIRFLTITSVLLSVAAAATLIDAIAKGNGQPLLTTLPKLRDAAWILAVTLIAGLALPRRHRARRGD